MRCLPEIRRGGQSWHLPLSEATARLLVLRRLDPKNTAGMIGPRDIEQTFLCDPALVLWCLCQDSSIAQSKLSLNKLVAWFLSVDINKLPLVDAAQPCDCSAKHVCRLAAKSLAAALASGRIKRRVRQQPKALAALLHNAPRWFLPTTRLADLPLSDSMRAAIKTAAKKHRKKKKPGKLSRKHRKQIDGTWQGHDTEWCKLLSLIIGSVGPNHWLQLEKLAAIRQLAYGASHEINNPLANISTRAQTMIRATEDDALVAHLSAINQQAFRAHEMIADLMFFANPPTLETSRTRVDELVRDVVAQVTPSVLGGESVTIQQDMRPIEVDADPAQLAMAVKAILKNAFEALRGTGTIWITVNRITNGSTRGMQLAIRDDGPGLSVDAQRHLFDPFFSGREAGRGLGFGLSKAWRIVQLHGGRLSAFCPQKGGTEFTIDLQQAAGDTLDSPSAVA